MNRTIIIIIHPGALGDVLLAVPAIKQLSVRFSQHTIVLIARAPVSRLLAECRVIDEWISIESTICTGLFASFSCHSIELRSYLARCDAAVAWIDDTGGSLAKVFHEFGIPQVHIQSPFSSALRGAHQRDRFLETVRQFSTNVPEQDGLQIPEHLLEAGNMCLKERGLSQDNSLILVHPGSGSVHKCLRAEKLVGIVQELQQRGMAPVLLEGPADHDTVEVVLQRLRKQPPVLRDLDLSLLAGVLAQTELYLGHDSGLTHLAALLGVRTIAVFGPTDHLRWAPQGDRVTVLRGAPCVCLSWDAVKQCREKPCLDLSSDEILAALKREMMA